MKHNILLLKSYSQHSLLKPARVKNEPTIVKDAMHYGEMLAVENKGIKLISFLNEHSK